MKDLIYLTVTDVISEYNKVDYRELFLKIFNKVQFIEPEIIEDEVNLQEKLHNLIDEVSVGKQDHIVKQILGLYDKYDLEEYLAEYLFFRLSSNGLFDIQDPKFSYLDNIVLDNYLLLKNPFLHSHKFYFKGVLDEDCNELGNFDSYKKSIVLGSNIPEKVYANLSADNRILVRELMRNDEKWYLFGKLAFDSELRINTIEVLKVLY